MPDYWNFWTFLLALVNPSIMYLQVFSLVSHIPHRVVSWRDHFYSQRKWFFGLNIILGMLVVIVWSNALTPEPANLIAVIGYSFITVLSVAGFVSDNPRLHAVIVSMAGGFTLLYYGWVTFNPVTF